MRLVRIEERTLRGEKPFHDQIGAAHQIGEHDGLVGRDDHPLVAAALAKLHRNRRLALRGGGHAEGAHENGRNRTSLKCLHRANLASNLGIPYRNCLPGGAATVSGDGVRARRPLAARDRRDSFARPRRVGAHPARADRLQRKRFAGRTPARHAPPLAAAQACEAAAAALTTPPAALGTIGLSCPRLAREMR